MKKISAKRKKEIYSLSSLLLHLIIFIGLLISLGTDADEQGPQNKTMPAKNEAVPALEALFANVKR